MSGFRCQGSFTPGPMRALPSNTQGRSRMREFRTSGSVRRALSNERPYREHCLQGRHFDAVLSVKLWWSRRVMASDQVQRRCRFVSRCRLLRCNDGRADTASARDASCCKFGGQTRACRGFSGRPDANGEDVRVAWLRLGREQERKATVQPDWDRQCPAGRQDNHKRKAQAFCRSLLSSCPPLSQLDSIWI